MCDNPRSGLHVRTVEVQRGGTGRLGEDQGIKFSQVLPSQGQEGELEKKRAGMMGIRWPESSWVEEWGISDLETFPGQV